MRTFIVRILSKSVRFLKNRGNYYSTLTVEASPWIAGFNPTEGQYGGYAEIMRELYKEEAPIMLVEYVKVWEQR